jgi:branched-chain amino acid transport system substrate-binding protein
MNFVRRQYLLAAAAALAAGGAGTAIAQANEIPVGVFNATTGTYAYGGVPIHNGMKLALEEANRKGFPGGAKLKLIEGDTAGDKGQTINLVNQFVRRDRVLMLFGPTTSVEALAAAPVVNELQVPMLTNASSNDVLKGGPWSFKIAASATSVMGYLADYGVKKLGARKIAIVFDQGNDGYVAQKNAFRDDLKKLGATVTGEEGIQASDSNFLALATKLASQDIDAVFLAAPAELSGNLIIQLRQAGIPSKVRFLGPPTLASQGFIKTGGKAVEGAVIVADYSPASPNPLNTSFVEAYKARYGTLPDNWAAMGYSAGLVGAQAIRNAGPNPDRAKVRTELAKLQAVPVVIGTGVWSLDGNRNPNYGGAVLVVKDGTFTSAQ